jgi:hypothetical protein
MVNFLHKSSKKSQQEVNVLGHLGTPSTGRPSVDSTLLGSDIAQKARPTTGLDSRRSSTTSTYSEQAYEEAHLPKEERVRLALARLRGPQYEELSGRIYGPWY